MYVAVCVAVCVGVREQMQSFTCIVVAHTHSFFLFSSAFSRFVSSLCFGSSSGLVCLSARVCIVRASLCADVCVYVSCIHALAHRTVEIECASFCLCVMSLAFA